MRHPGLKAVAAVVVLFTLMACARSKSSTAPRESEDNLAQSSPGSPDAGLSAPKDSAAAKPQFDSARAMQYVREIVAFGPRPVGSANHRKVENYILSHLKGDTVEADVFTAETPAGKLPVRNILAKFPGNKDGVIVVAGHYDTNYPLRNTSFIGANDGGSTAALLLELANQLRGRKLDGYSVWLLWTDGEEAIKEWSASDSLYGSRHLAEKWQADGTSRKIRAFILTDMIGDADLNIDRDQNSAPWLQALLLQAAARLGYQSHFFGRAIQVEDDHLPFLRIGVPVIDLIDLDYGYGNVFHHTVQDTVDKLSPKSIGIVGEVVLETIRLLNEKTQLPGVPNS
jgi:Zn-dependent M28 family amino/carboxypeptidase